MQIVMKSFDVMNLAKKDRMLKGNEFRVFMYLTEKANNKTAECFVLHSTVGGDLGLHVDTVRRVINRLVSKGYILKQQVKQQYTNNNSANLYTICQMLDAQSLKIKSKLIELFPVFKKGVDNKDEMVRVAIENLYATEEQQIEEPVVEEEVVEVAEEPKFIPSFKPSFSMEEKEVEPEVEEETEVAGEPKVSARERFLSLFNFDDRSYEVDGLMELVNEYEIIATKEQMKTLIHRFDLHEIKKSIHRAFASEFKHFNYIRSDLEGRLR